jgi:hypothetical protein
MTISYVILLNNLHLFLGIYWWESFLIYINCMIYLWRYLKILNSQNIIFFSNPSIFELITFYAFTFVFLSDIKISFCLGQHFSWKLRHWYFMLMVCYWGWEVLSLIMLEWFTSLIALLRIIYSISGFIIGFLTEVLCSISWVYLLIYSIFWS